MREILNFELRNFKLEKKTRENLKFKVQNKKVRENLNFLFLKFFFYFFFIIFISQKNLKFHSLSLSQKKIFKSKFISISFALFLLLPCMMELENAKMRNRITICKSEEKQKKKLDNEGIKSKIQ